MIDLDPTSIASGGWLEDTSLVEKYEMPDELYNARDGKGPDGSLVRCLSTVQYMCFFHSI